MDELIISFAAAATPLAWNQSATPGMGRLITMATTAMPMVRGMVITMP